jgi:hypothetical protein
MAKVFYLNPAVNVLKHESSGQILDMKLEGFRHGLMERLADIDIPWNSYRLIQCIFEYDEGLTLTLGAIEHTIRKTGSGDLKVVAAELSDCLGLEDKAIYYAIGALEDTDNITAQNLFIKYSEKSKKKVDNQIRDFRFNSGPSSRSG